MSDVNLANAGLEEVNEAAPKKGGNLVKGIVIITLVIVVEVVVAVMVVKNYVVPAGNAPQGTAASAAAAAAAEVHRPADTATEGGSIYEITGVVVNPAGTQGTRYLSATVGLETYDDHLLEELETREALVRDTLINILSSKRISELYGVTAKDSLRQEIINTLNSKLLNGRIARVYFTNYVIQ